MTKVVAAGCAVILQSLFLLIGHLVTPLPTVEKRGWKPAERKKQSKSHTVCKLNVLLLQRR